MLTKKARLLPLALMPFAAMRAVFAKAALHDPRTQQIVGIILIIVMSFVILLSFAYSWIKVDFNTESSRDYRYTPFGITDATDVCSQEMAERMGEKLLRSYVDRHSTRLDSDKGIYRIYMKADVGTNLDFHEVDVYCFVDKWDYDLSHYKEIDPTVKQVLTSDLKFFKD